MIRVVSAFYQKMRLQVDMICAERKLSTDHFATRPYLGKYLGAFVVRRCLSFCGSFENFQKFKASFSNFKVNAVHICLSPRTWQLYVSIAVCGLELPCLTVRPAKNGACAFHDLQARWLVGA
jgi:hypothetical protein